MTDRDSPSVSCDGWNKKVRNAPVLVNLARSCTRTQSSEISEPLNHEMTRAIKRATSTAEHTQETRSLSNEYERNRRKRVHCPLTRYTENQYHVPLVVSQPAQPWLFPGHGRRWRGPWKGGWMMSTRKGRRMGWGRRWWG